jgi:hypothetical protein
MADERRWNVSIRDGNLAETVSKIFRRTLLTMIWVGIVRITGCAVWTNTWGAIGTTIGCSGTDAVRWDTMVGTAIAGVPIARYLTSPIELERRSKQRF